jgi:hypothetical protein
MRGAMLMAAAVIIAGALIAAALWHGPRERQYQINNLLIVEDRWTNTISACEVRYRNSQWSTKCVDLVPE